MQALKTGSVVQGKKRKYQIRQMLSRSENSVSCLCRGEDGRQYRLKLYQQGCPMLGEVRKRYLVLPGVTGLAVPVDYSADPSLTFDIYGESGVDLAAHHVGMQEMIRYVIPQLNYGIYRAHRAGLLIRDIRPEHILFDPATHRACLCGFSNLAMITGGATATHAPARGIPACLYPPEYQTMGWSVYSDYYALGIALFLCLKGSSVFSGMTPQQMAQKAGKWELPGADREMLAKTAYGLLSVEQKMMYMIFGLTIPDPHQRWGSGELRCWCAGQELPLIQTGEKVRYDMTVPFVINGKRCWDYRQLGLEILKCGNGSEKTLSDLAGHMDRQNKAAAAEIRRIVSDRTLSVHGKYFRVGYTLAPGTSGFRWRGVCFRDTAELIRQSSGPGGTSDALSQMLADRCFSFLLELRGIKTPEQKRNLEAMRRLEQWEKEEKGKGAARFIMQMGRADQKGFYADGKFYHSFGQLFQAYQDKGVQLKKISGRILHDSMFQGWMWSQGFEMAAAAACRETMGDERAFFALLSLGEKTCSDSGKRLSRRLWLTYGADAPVTWLKSHLEWYQMESGLEMPLTRQKWSEECTLEELERNSGAMLTAYQNFVRNTETNPICLQCGIPPASHKSIRPRRAEAFFCCRWKQLEVTPDFIRRMDEAAQAPAIETWCKNALEESSGILEEELQKAQNMRAGIQASGAEKGEGGTVAGMVVWLLIGFWLFLQSMFGRMFVPEAGILGGLGILLRCGCLAAAAAFPVAALSWCYTRRMTRNQSEGKEKALNRRISELERRKREAQTAHNTIRQALLAGGGCELSAGGSPELSAFHGGSLAEIKNEMTGSGYRIAYVLSCIATMLLRVLADTEGSATLLSAGLYCAIAAAAIVWSGGISGGKAVRGFFFVFLTALVLYEIFHAWMLGAAIVIVIIIVVVLSN